MESKNQMLEFKDYGLPEYATVISTEKSISIKTSIGLIMHKFKCPPLDRSQFNNNSTLLSWITGEKLTLFYSETMLDHYKLAFFRDQEIVYVKMPFTVLKMGFSEMIVWLHTNAIKIKSMEDFARVEKYPGSGWEALEEVCKHIGNLECNFLLYASVSASSWGGWGGPRTNPGPKEVGW